MDAVILYPQIHEKANISIKGPTLLKDLITTHV